MSHAPPANNAIFFLRDVINFDNVMQLLQDSLNHFSHYPECLVDASQLQASNSAGIALLIEWIKYANKFNKALCFYSFPEHFMLLIQASNMMDVINPYVTNS